jgi:hypothetical protein
VVIVCVITVRVTSRITCRRGKLPRRGRIRSRLSRRSSRRRKRSRRRMGQEEDGDDDDEEEEEQAK